MQPCKSSKTFFSTSQPPRRIAHSNASESQSQLRNQDNRAVTSERGHFIPHQKSANQFTPQSFPNPEEDLGSRGNLQGTFAIHQVSDTARTNVQPATSVQSQVNLASLGTIEIPKSYGLFGRSPGSRRFKKTPFIKSQVEARAHRTEILSREERTEEQVQARRSHHWNPSVEPGPAVRKFAAGVDHNGHGERAFATFNQTKLQATSAHTPVPVTQLQPKSELKDKFVRAFASLDSSNTIKSTSRNDVHVYPSTARGSAVTSNFRPSPYSASSSSLTFYKGDLEEINGTDAEDEDEMPLNLSRPASVISVFNKPLDFRSPPPPSASQVYKYQNLSGSRCSTIASNRSQNVLRNAGVGGTLNMRKSIGNGGFTGTNASFSNPSMQNQSVQNQGMQSRSNSHQGQSFRFDEELEGSDNDLQILDERPQDMAAKVKPSTALPMPAKAHSSLFSGSAHIPLRQPNPGPFQPVRKSGDLMAGQTGHRESNTPTTDLIRQGVNKLNLSQGTKARLNLEQGQAQKPHNFSAIPPSNQALSGGVNVSMAHATATATISQLQATPPPPHAPQKNQAIRNGGTPQVTEKASQRGMPETHAPEPPKINETQRNVVSNATFRYNQAALRASLMLKDGCKMEADADRARQNLQANNLNSSYINSSNGTRSLLYQYDKDAPTSFKGLSLITNAGGYSATLVDQLEDNYMKYRNYLICKDGGLMTPYKFLCAICDQMKVSIHSEAFSFRGTNNEMQYRIELYVGGFCGVAHSQNIGFSKQLAAAHVLERMRVHCRAIKPQYYAVFPGSQFTKIKDKLDNLCGAFELGKPQYLYNDRCNGRGMSDDPFPRWECSVIVQNQEACVRSDNATYGSFLAAKNMYINFVRPPTTVSVVQIKDYFACGAECPLLKEVHPSLLLNVPSKPKMKWKEDNGLASIDPWLHDPTNESRYLLQANASGKMSKLAEFRGELEEAVEFVLYKTRRGNRYMTARCGTRMDVDMDDGNDEFHDAEDDSIMTT